jgi:hypothetical protein
MKDCTVIKTKKLLLVTVSAVRLFELCFQLLYYFVVIGALLQILLLMRHHLYTIALMAHKVILLAGVVLG